MVPLVRVAHNQPKPFRYGYTPNAISVTNLAERNCFIAVDFYNTYSVVKSGDGCFHNTNPPHPPTPYPLGLLRNTAFYTLVLTPLP